MMIFSGYVELLESICFEGQGVWTSSKKKTVGKSRIHQRDMWFLASQAVAASSSFNSRWRKVEDAAIKMMIGEGWGFILGLNFSPIISLEQLEQLEHWTVKNIGPWLVIFSGPSTAFNLSRLAKCAWSKSGMARWTTSTAASETSHPNHPHQTNRLMSRRSMAVFPVTRKPMETHGTPIYLWFFPSGFPSGNLEKRDFTGFMSSPAHISLELDLDLRYKYHSWLCTLRDGADVACFRNFNGRGFPDHPNGALQRC